MTITKKSKLVSSLKNLRKDELQPVIQYVEKSTRTWTDRELSILIFWHVILKCPDIMTSASSNKLRDFCLTEVGKLKTISSPFKPKK